jgi:hypothetical protein
MSSRNRGFAVIGATVGGVVGAIMVPITALWFPDLTRTAPEGAFWVALEFSILGASAFGAIASITALFLPIKGKSPES